MSLFSKIKKKIKKVVKKVGSGSGVVGALYNPAGFIDKKITGKLVKKVGGKRVESLRQTAGAVGAALIAPASLAAAQKGFAGDVVKFFTGSPAGLGPDSQVSDYPTGSIHAEAELQPGLKPMHVAIIVGGAAVAYYFWRRRTRK